MTSVSVQPDFHTETAVLRTRGGRLVGVEAITRTVRAVGEQFTVRGVEATIDGTLRREGDGWVLRASRTGEPFLLAPLRRKIQWNESVKRLQNATAAERGAYLRMTHGAKGLAGPVRISGPVASAALGKPPVLEVRTFRRLAPEKPR